jgi:protein O-GlcNAc transferase
VREEVVWLLHSSSSALRLAEDEERRGNVEGSIAYYKSAVRQFPGLIQARLALGRAQTKAGQISEAITTFQLAVRRAPNNVVALRSLCWLTSYIQDFPASLATVDRLEALGCDVAQELARVAIGFMHQCDWGHRDKIYTRLKARFASGTPCIVDTYAMLGCSDDPRDHLDMARCIAAALSEHTAPMPRPVRHGSAGTRRGRRLRVGYISSHLNNHPLAIAMAGIFENHDRVKFEVSAYDHSAEDGSEIRARIVAAFERFVRLGANGPDECAAMIAADGIDILIDLDGYTFGTRSEILALRPAPIQVNFLGYVGSQANNWIDYVIADKEVLPFSEQENWSERIIHLPGCYFPNDRSRAVPAARYSEGYTLHGLPETAFVFACFNSCYKISPVIFALWMKLLHTVQNSVLWLYRSNQKAVENLRATAKSMNIAPERLVFAEPLPFDDHIRRHAYADLFLDTFPYGAHTTGADALWAGLPVVTIMGTSFASRVGGSLLHSVCMPELICEGPEDYFSLALQLAREPQKLTSLRDRLTAIRMTTSLFDAAKFASALEHEYLKLADRS